MYYTITNNPNAHVSLANRPCSFKYPAPDSEDWNMLLDLVRNNNVSKYFSSEGDELLQEVDDNCRGVCVLEYENIDIELNLSINLQGKIFADYFVCVRWSEVDAPGSWDSDDYVYDWVPDGECSVDWNADNWVDLLQKDMQEKLEAYINVRDYDIDTVPVEPRKRPL